jgi:hypothetical protein
MGGSTQEKTTNTTQNTQPWRPAQPLLGSILNQLNGINPQLTGNEQAALGGLSNNAGFLGQFTPPATGLANSLLAGGGATATAPMLNDAYAQYLKTLAPFTDPNSLDPAKTPGFGSALATLNSDISNQINGQFAAAGRDLSGANTQALARGLSQGEGGLIQNQYNTNVGNLMNAAASAYGAGNTTGGILAGLNQQDLANRQAGLSAARTAQGFANDPFNQQLAVAAAARGIPVSTLQQIAAMGVPIAGLGSSSSGTQQTQTTTPFNPLSLAPLALMPLGGGFGSSLAGSLLGSPGGYVGGGAGAPQAGSGILGMFGPGGVFG